MILKTTLHKIIDAFENGDEMSCFAPYFKDEEGEGSIYSFCRPLTNNHLPKYRANLPHLQNFKHDEIKIPSSDRKTQAENFIIEDIAHNDGKKMDIRDDHIEDKMKCMTSFLIDFKPYVIKKQLEYLRMDEKERDKEYGKETSGTERHLLIKFTEFELAELIEGINDHFKDDIAS